MINSFTDLTAAILMMIWMAYRLFFASELYKNVRAGVYSKPDNAIMIVLIEGFVYLILVFIFFPFEKQAQGWTYVFWYVSVILCMWCFMYVIKYFIWKKENKDI